MKIPTTRHFYLIESNAIRQTHMAKTRLILLNNENSTVYVCIQISGLKNRRKNYLSPENN